MITSEQASEARTTARDLLRFLDELMRAIVGVDIGDPAVAQLTMLEMRILLRLGEEGRAMAINQIAAEAGASVGQASQASDRLRGRGLLEHVGGGRGGNRSLSITGRGRRALASLAASREAAVENFISGLDHSQRLRLQGATHLLGGNLERLAGPMLPA